MFINNLNNRSQSVIELAPWQLLGKTMILGSGIIRKLSELYILTTPWVTEPETSNARKRFEDGSVSFLLPKMEKKETVKLKITHRPQIGLEKLRTSRGARKHTISQSIDRWINRSINQFFTQCNISGTHVKTWDESYPSYSTQRPM